MTADRQVSTLHLTNAWHPSSGGIRTFYLALLGEAAKRDRRMTVIVPGPRDSAEQFGAGTRLVTLRAPRVPFLDRRYRAIWPHRFVGPTETALWRWISTIAPDVIEVSDKFSLCHLAGLVKRRAGPRPTVIGLSQERMDDALAAHLLPMKAAATVARSYLRKVYMRQFDAHIANSDYTAGELRDAVAAGGPAKPLLWRLRNRIYVRPLGVDVDGFSPAERSSALRADLARRFGRTAISHLAVFAGRLSAEKGVGALVPALAECRARGLDIVLAVAGDGPLARTMALEAEGRARGQVLFLGHIVHRRELARLVASADVFVHPNPREPFGIGPLEAMACGTPVVLPRAGGVLTYASDRNAWLAGPGPVGLARAIEACCLQPAEAGWRRLQALEDVKWFGWPSAAGRYFDTYDSVHVLREHQWISDPSVSEISAVDTFVDIAHREG